MAPPDKPKEAQGQPSALTNQKIKTAGENLSAPDAGRQEAGARALETATEQVKKDPVFTDTIIASLNSTKISPEIRARLEALLAKINPEAALKRATERSSKPSDATKSLLSETKDNTPPTIDNTKLLKSLVDKTSEQIQEQFRSLNKKDIQLIFASLDQIKADTKIDGVDQKKIEATKKAIETVMGMMLGKMIENGHVIDDITDITFLETHGGQAVQTFIQTEKGEGKSLNKFDPKNPLVLKSEKGVLSVKSAISKSGEKVQLLEGLDLNKLNTVDLEAMRKEAQKTAGSDDGRIVMERFRDAFGPLVGDNNILSKILKSLFSFLGINFDEKKEKPTDRVEFEKKVAYAMINEKKDNKNIFERVLKEGKLPDDIKSPDAQSYIKQTQDLIGQEEYESDKKTRKYGTETQRKVEEIQATLIKSGYLKADGFQKGILDQTTAQAHLDWNNAGRKDKEAPPAEASKTPETINTGRMSLDLAKKIGEKATLEDIKKDRTLVKSIQDALGVEHKKGYGVYGPRTTKAMNEWYTNTLKLTGNVDPKQIKTLLEKPAAPKEAKK